MLDEISQIRKSKSRRNSENAMDVKELTQGVSKVE